MPVTHPCGFGPTKDDQTAGDRRCLSAISRFKHKLSVGEEFCSTA